MTPYFRTISAVLTREFATYISTSKKVHKKFGESTHITRKTRSMQIATPSSSGADGTIDIKPPTYDGRRVPRWYASMMSSLDTCTGPVARSSYQITWSMQGKERPDCINSGATSMLVLLLTLRVP